MRQRINRLLMLGKRGLTGPIFQRIGGRLWAHAGVVQRGPRMESASIQAGCQTFLVETTEEYVGDPSATWVVKILGVGDFPATGESYEPPT